MPLASQAAAADATAARKSKTARNQKGSPNTTKAQPGDYKIVLTVFSSTNSDAAVLLGKPKTASLCIDGVWTAAMLMKHPYQSKDIVTYLVCNQLFCMCL